jgi:hypothetical protein
MDNKLKLENKMLKGQLKAKAELEKVNNNLTTGFYTSVRKNLTGLGYTFNGNRDMYKVLGYDKAPTIDDYYKRYKRQDIATRLVEAYPEACWGGVPYITDDEDTQEKTPFEKTYLDLLKRNNLKIFDTLKRADVLANIGEFSVLYININDGKDPSEPLTGTYTIDDVLFIKPFLQTNVNISKVVTEKQDPFYGYPETYDLTFNGHSLTNLQLSQQVVKVHRSRILHIAENSLENDIIGRPRLESVYNRLEDLEKVVGGGAETFFLNSRGGLNLVLDKDASIDDPERLEEELQDFSNNLTRYLKTQGAEAKPLNFHSSDPKQYFDIIISLISASTKIPTRILIGAERGQLASGQDENNWIARVKERQNNFCENIILKPLIDFFIKYGILAPPKNEMYTVVWEDLKVISNMERSDIATKMTTAIEKYVGRDGNAQEVITKKQFVKDILGMEYREKELVETTFQEPSEEVETPPENQEIVE